MNIDETVRAVTEKGFTERQARFLVLVARHSGVCVMRQYPPSPASSSARRPGSSSPSSSALATSRRTTAPTTARASTTFVIGSLRGHR